jgi:hypothetical protein
MFVLHFIGGFTAQLGIEQARRSAIAADRRAVKAEKEATGIRLQLERLAGTERVESWAALNGFHPSYLAVNETPPR